MTNLEKYYHKVINKNLDDDVDISCTIHDIRTGCRNCDEYNNCNMCRNDSFKWLGEEYVEPETDWSKVPIDTKVLVWSDNTPPVEKELVAYYPGLNFPFITYDDDKKNLIQWSCCKLVEEE